MIHVLHSVLAPGVERDYEIAHRRVPDRLAEALVRSGISDWSIHRVGRHLIHVIATDDLSASFEKLGHEPANDDWQATIGAFVESFEPADEGGTPIAVPTLWSLNTQLFPDDGRSAR